MTLSKQLVSPMLSLLLPLLLVGVLILAAGTPLVQGLLSTFQPSAPAPSAIPVSLEDLRALKGLENYGTLHTTGATGEATVRSAADAAARTDLIVPAPAYLPSGISQQQTYSVLQPSTIRFTLSAAKARAAAAAAHRTFAPPPVGLDGSTLTATIGPALVITFGNGQGLPPLLVAEGALPRLRATGASVSAIERYLLVQPGISSALHAAIQALGDPNAALPIPIPASLAGDTTHIQVQGVQGLAIDDSSGLGSAIVWQRNGLIYAVAGTLPLHDARLVAGSLHE